MNRRASLALFVAFLAAAAIFVGSTAAALPPVVASHFNASGAANGFMTRTAYTALVMLLLVGAPLLLAFVPFTVIGSGGAGLNIPDRHYWLAPERREQTIGFLRQQGLLFAALVAVFLVYVHWLVVRANQLRPPQLSTAALVAGLAVFLVALGAWLVVLFGRFRTRTRKG
jgi:uncharacterized membrane protein